MCLLGRNVLKILCRGGLPRPPAVMDLVFWFKCPCSRFSNRYPRAGVEACPYRAVFDI